MKIAVHETSEAMGRAAAEKAADILRRAIEEKGRAAFVAATGASQFAFLDRLVQAAGVAWDRTTMFHLDEYIGLPADHPASFRRYLRERLVSRVPIGAAHFIAGDAEDLSTELERLSRLLAATPIDVAFVGVGENGHLAFNDPPADFDTERPYLVVALDQACRQQQFGEGWFPSFEAVPKRAVSMSIKQIMKSKAIVCTVPEKRKAKALQAALEGPIGPQVPASILRQHERCFLFTDREAAGLVQPATIRQYS